MIFDINTGFRVPAIGVFIFAVASFEASSPGRVAFGAYDTGFITFNELDTGRMPREYGVQVTDGMIQTQDD